VRILVTGSRDWWCHTTILYTLSAYNVNEPNTLVHGGARGADRMAAYVARQFGWYIEAHPVTDTEWRLSRSAGNQRNQRMVDLGADVCLAFPLASSRGTWDCARRARAAGIHVQVVRPYWTDDLDRLLRARW
jgi:hypothetical protein